jgi:hypothetical protein
MNEFYKMAITKGQWYDVLTMNSDTYYLNIEGDCKRYSKFYFKRIEDIREEKLNEILT